MDKNLNLNEVEKQEKVTRRATYMRTARSFKRKRLLEEHGNKCGYCGCEMISPELMEVDSYLPFRTHPECDEYDNYVLTCPICNRIKSAREPITTDGRVLILHPYKDNYKDEIKIDEDGYAHGLTDAGKSTVEIMRLNRPELVAYRVNNIAAFIEKVNDGKSAYDVYQKSISQITELMKVNVESSELQEYYFRLLYANVISAMEAYLSKTIITLVLNDENSLWNFVRKFKWNEEKVKIADVKEVYDGINVRVQTELAGILYHNLSKVKKMYKEILDIDILTDHNEMNFLYNAVETRHDIVHRNGRANEDLNEEKYHDIQIEHIQQLILHVDKLVNSIQEQLIISDVTE